MFFPTRTGGGPPGKGKHKKQIGGGSPPPRHPDSAGSPEPGPRSPGIVSRGSPPPTGGGTLGIPLIKKKLSLLIVFFIIMAGYFNILSDYLWPLLGGAITPPPHIWAGINPIPAPRKNLNWTPVNFRFRGYLFLFFSGSYIHSCFYIFNII